MIKIIYALLMILLLVGCTNQNNITPKIIKKEIKTKKKIDNSIGKKENNIEIVKKKKLTPIVKVEKLLKSKIKFKKIKFKKTNLLYINLGTFVKFDSGKYKIKTLYKNNIKKIFLPLKDKNITLLIVGHTDSIGNDIYNQALSEVRAKEVYNLFLQLGFKKKHLDYIGYGEEQPIATNATKNGRSKNRRVEILIDKDLNISNTFLKQRKINKMFLNNHNTKSAGKVIVTKKGWSKNLNNTQLKKYMIKCSKPKRQKLIQSFSKRSIIINFKRRSLNNIK